MGRPKGSKNKQKLHLTSPPGDDAKKPTAAERMRALKRRVALCVHAGQTVETISAVLEIPVEKLKLVFARELEHGFAIVEAEERFRLDESSAAGKVAASKIILGAADGSGDAKSAGKFESESLNSRALRIIQGGAK